MPGSGPARYVQVMNSRVHVGFIVSAEGAIFSGLASMVVAPTVRGEVGILARHAPMLARLKAEVVRVTLGGVQEGEKSFFVSSGLLEVQPYIVTKLADTVLRDEQMDEVAALAAKQRVEREFNGKKLTPEESDNRPAARGRRAAREKKGRVEVRRVPTPAGIIINIF
jgi:F-type H+-transporting ATPase subunit epsilon